METDKQIEHHMREPTDRRVRQANDELTGREYLKRAFWVGFALLAAAETGNLMAIASMGANDILTWDAALKGHALTALVTIPCTVTMAVAAWMLRRPAHMDNSRYPAGYKHNDSTAQA